MNCPQCHEVVEPDAKFCGNCGQALTVGRLSDEAFAAQAALQVQDEVPAAPPLAAEPELEPGPETEPGSESDTLLPPADPVPVPPPALPSTAGAPGYSLASPVRQKAESRSLTALLLGILSLPGAIVPVVGLALSVCGLVLATSSRAAATKKKLSNAAIGFAILGIVLSIASAAFSYTYTAQQQGSVQQIQVPESSGSGSSRASGSSGSSRSDGAGDIAVTELSTDEIVDTPCFRVKLPAALVNTADTTEDSCNIQARDAETFNQSGNLFAVSAAKNTQVTAENFNDVAQEVLKRNANLLLPGYTAGKGHSATFAGSPAYVVDATQDAGNAVVQMALVLHIVNHGENVFIVGHGSQTGQADVMRFASNWEWEK